MISSNIAPPPLSLLSSSPNNFSFDLRSYPNINRGDALFFAPASEPRLSGRVGICPQPKLGFLSFSLSPLRPPPSLNATAKYAFPKRFNSSNLEEAFMSVPDLETMNFRVLSRTDRYEIREVEPYYVAETTMPGGNGFDFYGASRSFNVLAEYLFGKNTVNEKMEMTTPVVTRKVQSVGEKMEMTTPVITRKAKDQTQWQMSFVMPSKYGSDLPLPKDPSVKIQEVPRKIVAVLAFSGYVTDEEIERREQELRRALQNDKKFRVRDGVSVEVAQVHQTIIAKSNLISYNLYLPSHSLQYNPPFTLPFTRRNEVSLEVESKDY
ncbi:unnamed protein product [Brassica oleracea]|uniref:(rape) hypothetical protein n=1 Tax=Brassica napus TaxID=3708 RepID=A0A816LC81_BRANA|nr:unnamed protein product [Brassica napus]